MNSTKLPNFELVFVTNNLKNISIKFSGLTLAIMNWRMFDSKGTMKFLSDYDVNKLQRQYCKIYEVCEKHKVVCSGKRAFSLHLQEEHVY